MNFTRGLNPKVAMGTGLPKCVRCHTILKDQIEIEWQYCGKCMLEMASIWDREADRDVDSVNLWDRLTTFSKVLVASTTIITIILLLAKILSMKFPIMI